MNARACSHKRLHPFTTRARSSDTLRRVPGPRLAAACATVAFLLAAAATPAGALVAPAQLVDGPSAAIREVGGVAMSADGTGGIVYRKDDGGRPHIYAAQYVGGAWRPPQRVDTGPTQGFESAWPAIAAGDGGRLLVVWTQEFGAADRLYSAALQPGARRFEAPIPVDLNIGEMSLGTWPSVTMAPGGQAYLVYRVITDPEPSSAPPGSVLGEYRVARFTGQLWSGFGIPVNRNLENAQSTPSAADRPRIGVDQLGNAVVAWEERDDQFIPRVYARRVFPTSTGIALQVSPSSFGGAPLSAGVSQFALSVGPFGESAIAWRQDAPAPGAGGAFTRSRLLVAQSPDEYSPSANVFADPRAFDGGGADGPAGGIGSVAVAASGAAVLTAFGQGAAALAADGDDQAAQQPVRVDDGGGAAPTDPVVTLGASGSAALAWKRNAGGRGGVVVRERRSDGVTSDRRLSGPRGGVVDDVQLGGSGLGDALVGWSQGTGAGRQITAGAGRCAARHLQRADADRLVPRRRRDAPVGSGAARDRRRALRRRRRRRHEGRRPGRHDAALAHDRAGRRRPDRHDRRDRLLRPGDDERSRDAQGRPPGAAPAPAPARARAPRERSATAAAPERGAARWR